MQLRGTRGLDPTNCATLCTRRLTFLYSVPSLAAYSSLHFLSLLASSSSYLLPLFSASYSLSLQAPLQVQLLYAEDDEGRQVTALRASRKHFTALISLRTPITSRDRIPLRIARLRITSHAEAQAGYSSFNLTGHLVIFQSVMLANSYALVWRKVVSSYGNGYLMLHCAK